MKRYIKYTEDIMAIANVNYKRSGLSCNIWSGGQGCTRNKPDVVPRVKLRKDDDWISVSIEEHPRVLAPRGNWRKDFKQDTIDAFEEGIEYVARNYDLFLAHYNDRDLSFDDEDLFNALRTREEYK